MTVRRRTPGTVFLVGVLQGGAALLFAFGRADLAVIQSVIGLAVNVGLNALLLPQFGVDGAVIALLSAYVVRLIVMSRLVSVATASARARHVG